MKYLINNSNNPYYNLAFEEYCFKNLPRGEKYLFFYINKPAIIIGKNQNTLEEINKKYVDEKDIKVVRRITGGGAVYHDLGNLNFSIIDEEKSEDKIDFKTYNESVIKALKLLGVKADLSGRNDILIDGKKISGIAQSNWNNRILNHGTLMFDVNLEDMVKSLHVNEDKLISKGIKSIRSRVTNIKEYLEDKDLDVYELRDILTDTIFQVEGIEKEEYILSEEELKGIEKLYEDKYNSWEWNYGESPKAEYKNYKKFPAGAIDIRFDLIEGRMKNISIYGDFFGAKDTKEIIELLDGKKYEEKEIRRVLNDVDIKDYFGNITMEDFIDLVF